VRLSDESAARGAAFILKGESFLRPFTVAASFLEDRALSGESRLGP
jgi:hypothetical protein